MKYKIFTILVIGFAFVSLGLFFLDRLGTTSTDNSPEWSRYESKSLGVSFEYPSDQIDIRDKKHSFENAIEAHLSTEISVPNGTNVKTVEIGIMPDSFVDTVPPSPPVHSLEEMLLAEVKAGNRPGGKPNTVADIFPNIQYVTLDGVRAAVNKIDNSPHEAPETDVYFFANGHPYMMRITGLSDADTQRVWQSLKFLNK